MTVHGGLGGVRAFSLCQFVKLLLIMCGSKDEYSAAEQDNFNAHIREILQHDGYRAKVKDHFKNIGNIKKTVEVWELADSVLNASPEEKRAKYEELEEMVGDTPSYGNILKKSHGPDQDEESMNSICKRIMLKTCEVLAVAHKDIAGYLKLTYGPAGKAGAAVDTSNLSCQKCGRLCRSRIGLFSHFKKCQRT